MEKITFDFNNRTALVTGGAQGFGLDIAKWEPSVLEIPEHISKLADERQRAREDKNWQLADEIRDELLSRGYEVEDTRDGPRINKT